MPHKMSSSNKVNYLEIINHSINLLSELSNLMCGINAFL